MHGIYVWFRVGHRNKCNVINTWRNSNETGDQKSGSTVYNKHIYDIYVQFDVMLSYKRSLL